MKSPSTRRRAAAFTLIELLVVIVIIAILASISLPVFSRVMERGKATKCAANLRQIGIGSAAFINDNEDILFGKVDTSGGGGGGNLPWPQQLNPQYLDSTKIFVSPFDPRGESTTTTYNVSYGLNSNAATNKDTSKWSNTSSLVLIAPNPTGTAGALVFGGKSDTAASVILSKPTSATTKLGTHSSGSQISVLFADFHVAPVKWTDFAMQAPPNPPPIYWTTNGTN